MDGAHFASLTRSLLAGSSRRRLAGFLATLGLSALGSGLSTEAKHKHKKHKKHSGDPGNPGPPAPDAPPAVPPPPAPDRCPAERECLGECCAEGRSAGTASSAVGRIRRSAAPPSMCSAGSGRVCVVEPSTAARARRAGSVRMVAVCAAMWARPAERMPTGWPVAQAAAARASSANGIAVPPPATHRAGPVTPIRTAVR
jgi:hypothetical protein